MWLQCDDIFSAGDSSYTDSLLRNHKGVHTHTHVGRRRQIVYVGGEGVIMHMVGGVRLELAEMQPCFYTVA